MRINILHKTLIAINAFEINFFILYFLNRKFWNKNYKFTLNIKLKNFHNDSVESQATLDIPSCISSLKG